MIKYKGAGAKEALTFNEKEAWVYKADQEHPYCGYDVISDTTEGDERILRLKKKDLTENKAKVKKIVDKLLENIGETDSKTMKELLTDVINDYSEDTLDRIDKKLTKGKAPVKTKEGCFNIFIGDGRKKNSERIRIR